MSKMKHATHKDQLINLKKIEGQVRGLQAMIEGEKYCIDILNQVKAVKNALVSVEGKILKVHLRSCIKDSLSAEELVDDKIEEIVSLLKR
ncbi:metal-sensitive transcriptional regulator [Gammaproteobacteria bacterium]|nr:metal-sensitive transcriptional regulator [Gammaproteobacteria bacterium]MDB4210187.1 metal-sensitive transcriptional regulator [Gammaproteobacteria bacterium]MDC0091442.1 metal-sensitive transcriptional regulator [Gammaproteobacteria bacterium]MDC1525282.1 metal-sensitive transcriptional regulator [Gammaproteobacteria bacterium]|tara:strand:+ start:776 stop:1045 length:270 start_codon:yes stop_codon:yes gene_type:complete